MKISRQFVIQRLHQMQHSRVQLESIRAVREGVVIPRTMNFAEHTLRIPEDHYHALLKIFPNLNSRDGREQSAEWERFFASPYAEPYRVARTPVQVQRATRAQGKGPAIHVAGPPGSMPRG